MSISNAFAEDLLNLLFHGTAIADIAENDTTSPQTTVHISLHYDDPGEGGTQTTNEASYTNYVRVSKLRTATATGGFKNATATDPPTITFFGTETCDFPESGGADANTPLDWFAVGKSAHPTAGDIWWSGAVSPAIAVGAAGITPRLTNATTITLD